jgi:peptidoglycan biosynthesis protein MviN/MurJ (putative lipid II flippase)
MHPKHIPTAAPGIRRFVPLDLLRRATGRAFLGTIAGNAPGFLLPFAIALRFHIGHLTDAYAFALGVALFASGVFTGVLQANALPILQRMKRLGRAAFVNRLRAILVSSTCIATLLYAVIAFGSIIYIDQQSHWTSQQHALLVASTAVFAMFVLASGVNSLLSAALNALDSFFVPAASQAIKSVAPLAAILFVPRDAAGLLVVASLVAAGELLRTGYLYVHLHTALPSIPVLKLPDGYAKELPMWRVAGPHGLSLLIAAASPLIDRGVAASLPAGSVTIIDLGEKTFLVPITILSTSLVLVAGTHWASLLTDDLPALRRHFRQTLLRGTAVCLVLFVGMCGALGILAALAGSTFAGAPTGTVIVVIVFLLAGLPGAFVINAGSRLLASTRSTYLLPWFALCSFTTNLVFDIIGANWLGVRGIALSSTIYRCVNAVLYLLVIRRLMENNFEGLRSKTRRNPGTQPDHLASPTPPTPVINDGAAPR